MRRVSSRQRLVSWDAFDAAASQSDAEDANQGGYCRDMPSSFALEGPLPLHALGGSIQPLCSDRKREREAPVKSITPIVIQAQKSYEVTKPPPMLPVVTTLIEKPRTLIEKTRSRVLPFDALIDDVQLHVFSFLSASEARDMALVSKHYRRLLHSKEALPLWTAWFQSYWPSFPKTTGVEFLDLLHLPASLVSTTAPNMSVLMGMAARHFPTSIDKNQLNKSQRRHSEELELVTPETTRFRTLEIDGRSVTQFLGRVGRGNRCIRADQPLSRPEYIGKPSPFVTKASVFKHLFCRSAHAVARSNLQWRPFVAPHVINNTNNQTTIVNMTPRLVSYYEVSILACPVDSPLDTNGRRSRVADCIAVGVSTFNFHLHSRMPGWDNRSYGYHGDDGGIFHGAGDMSNHFGRSFGEGDTVGCGIDYVTGGIFFSLNGEFLGYGWTGIDVDFLQQDLYPTVGVDSNLPIECNFGERPFAFDLTLIVERQKYRVKECWCAARSSHVSIGAM